MDKPQYKTNFYDKLPSALDPKYNEYFGGYRVNAGDFSATTDPRTANIVKDVHDKLNTGIKNVELTLIQTLLAFH